MGRSPDDLDDDDLDEINPMLAESITVSLDEKGGLSFVVGDTAKVEPSVDANQLKPRRYYVYAHEDNDGQYFYIGKGTGRRAWSKERHVMWHRYVEKHLKGSYKVKILQDDLDKREAEWLEASWVRQEGDKLVNWVNPARKFKYDESRRFHRLRDKNRELIKQANAMEQSDLGKAIEMYEQAIENTSEYAFIQCETGLIGELLAEEEAELGTSGEPWALNRCTLCLIKLGNDSRAVEIADQYFKTYRRDEKRYAGRSFMKRVEKARARLAQK